MNIHILILVLIIIGGGFLGGVANFYIHISSETSKWVQFSKSIFLGFASAVVVPLFLNLLSSSIIDYTSEYKITNYLVFAGFCIIAATFSDKFMQSVGSKIIKDIKDIKRETEQNTESIESLISIDTELEEAEDEEISVESVCKELGLSQSAEPQIKDIIEKLRDGRFQNTNRHGRQCWRHNSYNPEIYVQAS